MRRCEAAQGLEPACLVVGVDEQHKVTTQLIVIVVVVAFDGRVLDCAVHSFDLTIGPRMVRLRQTMLDPVLPATHIEHVGDEAGGRAAGVSRRKAELDAIVGQHRVDAVGNGLDQGWTCPGSVPVF